MRVRQLFLFAGFWASLWATASASAQAENRPAWVSAWAAPQLVMNATKALPPEDLTDATLRQIVRITASGDHLRVRISNVFGTTPLDVDAISIAHAQSPGSSKIIDGTAVKVTFGGLDAISIPPGADYLSDPIAIPVKALDELALSLHLPAAPQQQTGHPDAFTTTFYAHGNQVAAPDLTDAKAIQHWFQIDGIDVDSPTERATVAVLGDSITDGCCVKPDSRGTWPDVLAGRLAESRSGLSLVNLGIGGNHLLTDGIGPNALSRLDRDVFDRPGVKYLVVFEGINDLGGLSRQQGPIAPETYARLVTQVLAAYDQIIDRAHEHGIKVIGATISPFGGGTYYFATPPIEADRQAINTWIRTKGHFDGVIDFDALLRDPDAPDRLNPIYDGGDHLHPWKGYQAMGALVDLSLFAN